MSNNLIICHSSQKKDFKIDNWNYCKDGKLTKVKLRFFRKKYLVNYLCEYPCSWNLVFLLRGTKVYRSIKQAKKKAFQDLVTPADMRESKNYMFGIIIFKAGITDIADAIINKKAKIINIES